MIKSMTGFGRHELEKNGIKITVELKAVNNKFFDFNCRITRGYSFLEDKLKSYIQSKVSRGKLDAFVSITTDSNTPYDVTVNQSLVDGYMRSLSEIKDKYSLDNEPLLATIARIPDVFTVTKEPLDEEELWLILQECTDMALDGLINMRLTEGERMKADIIQKADNIKAILAELEKTNPETIAQYRARLQEKIEELLGNNTIEEQRIITEVAIFADKVAIDEELVRLKSHFDQLDIMLSSDQPIGRKLDFLIQEMNREINTIGSKSQNSTIAHMVVDVKSEIEKMREQVQNIE